MLNLQDVLVISVLAAVAGWPFIQGFVSNIQARTPAAPPAPVQSQSVEAWRQEWATTLIALIADLEDGKGHFTKPEEAIKLARKLAWQVVGGDGVEPSAK
jgi:hypothetical protein